MTPCAALLLLGALVSASHSAPTIREMGENPPELYDTDDAGFAMHTSPGSTTAGATTTRSLVPKEGSQVVLCFSCIDDLLPRRPPPSPTTKIKVMK
ncbi:hypothetical protein GDO81_025780 [Engystomops pustulosus]|uniref:Secreted protein n=1 Tax=Engystomops pustulosus TaxID=76066 RepID=A0AAV6YNB1_ENGPU|nr:hypothetical protein GDO81_025780 [Engystomops pustulosus]